MKVQLLSACAVGALVMGMGLMGCDSSKAAVAKGSSSIQETALTDEPSAVAWTTKDNISVSRKIEVGDHPNIKLEKFEIGSRAQRIRFMISDDVNTGKYVSGSPQDEHFRGDGPIAKSENEKWSLFGMVIDTPKNLGWAKFSDNSSYNGVSVSPQLLLCAAGALSNLKEAGSTRSRIFQNWQLDMVNIFVKPVQHADEAESKMAIDPQGHTLNFQLSLWTRSGDCFLPTAGEIGEALDIADQRVHD